MQPSETPRYSDTNDISRGVVGTLPSTPDLSPINTELLRSSSPRLQSSIGLSIPQNTALSSSDRTPAAGAPRLSTLQRSQSLSNTRPSLPRANSAGLPSGQVGSGGSMRRTRQQPHSDARRVNADEHWLSEDEGVNQVQAYLDDNERRINAGDLGSSSGRTGSTRPRRDDEDDPDNAALRAVALKKNAATEEEQTQTVQPVQERAPSGIDRNRVIHHRLEGVVQTQRPPDEVPIQLDAMPETSHLLDILSDALICAICSNSFQEPTTLECGHSFCLRCIAGISRSPKPTQSDLSPVTLQHETFVTTAATLPSAQTSMSSTSAVAEQPAEASTESNRRAGGVFGRTIPFFDSLRRSPSVSSGLPISAPTTTDRTKLCPLAECSRPAKASTEAINRHGRILEIDDGKRIDVTLSKVNEIIQNHRRIQQEVMQVLERSSEDSAGSFESLTDENGKRSRKVKPSRHLKRSKAGMSGEKASLSDVLSDLQAAEADSETLSKAKERELATDLLGELECQVCYALFADPITSHCGHTFCRKCIARSLDHSDKCPMCRTRLPAYSYFMDHPPNRAILGLLKTGFKKIYQDRLDSMVREEAVMSLDMPIFVCTLAFPNTPTFLHIFEPRYRLMMRRVMDRDKRFGMVLPSQRPGGVHPYGTVLEIRSLELLPDGRFMIETIGVSRFKLIQTGSLDGYTVAQVEPIVDIPEHEERELERATIRENQQARFIRSERVAAGEDPEYLGPPIPEELTTEQLVARCHEFLETLRTGAAPWLRQKLNDTLGPCPDNSADFSFYMAACMPIYEYEKARLLPITSPRLRLRLLVFWIDQLRSSWWFNRGCSIM